MAKKPSVFSAAMMEMQKEDDARAQQPASPAPPAVPTAFRHGAVGALHSDLRQSIGQNLRDIDLDLIDMSPFADRMKIRDEDVADLVESIRKNGLRVPILLRPNPQNSGRFIIVYGRRRLAALRILGKPAKALIREMSEEESILVQGLENNARVDPSFIEKALFAVSLEKAGYGTDIILDALCISKSYLAHMHKVLNHIPHATINAIGSAHGVGWKRWHEAVNLIIRLGLTTMIPDDFFGTTTDSAERFEIWLTHLKTRKPDLALNTAQLSGNKTLPKNSAVFVSDGGPMIGEVRRSSSGKVSLISDPEQIKFSRWLSANGEVLLTQIYADWAKSDGA